MVVDRLGRDHWSVLVRDPEPRHGLWEVVGVYDREDTGHLRRWRGVDCVDCGASDGNCGEGHVRRIGERDVAQVALSAGYPIYAPVAVNPLADYPVGVSIRSIGGNAVVLVRHRFAFRQPRFG